MGPQAKAQARDVLKRSYLGIDLAGPGPTDATPQFHDEGTKSVVVSGEGLQTREIPMGPLVSGGGRLFVEHDRFFTSSSNGANCLSL